MVDTQQFARQSGIINNARLHETPITLIGLGGIGSMTGLTLCKMGARDVTVYDDDELETHNISNQTYPVTWVGKPKVEAFKELIKFMEDFDVYGFKRQYTGKEDPEGILICGVDSMKARIEIFDNILENRQNTELYIDARMGSETMMIHAVDLGDPESIGFYQTTLYSDEDADPIPCTERAIIYNTAGIAGFVGSIVKRWINGEKLKRQYNFDYKTETMLNI